MDTIPAEKADAWAEYMARCRRTKRGQRVPPFEEFYETWKKEQAESAEEIKG